jgi:predicted dehydrogenase
VNRRKLLIGSSVTLATPFIAGKSSRPRIRIGQIGLSHPHALGKLAAIRSLEGIFELVGVVEPDPKLRQKVRGVKYISIDELMSSPSLEVVAIETRVSDLVRTAQPIVDAGKHIHLDKPAGPTLAPFKKLLESAERQNLTIQMGYMLRYNPSFTFMFRAVRENWFGEIMEIDAMMGKKAGVGMRRELAQFAGGGFFELAGHILDAVVHLLGKPKMVQGFNLRTRQNTGDSFADNQLAVLEYEKATVCLRCNHNDPFGGPRRRFIISGTRGGMEIQPLESGKFTLNLYESREGYRKGSQLVDLKGGRSYAMEFEDLARTIRGEKKLDWNYEHDLTVHHTLLRICGMA